MSPGLRGVPVTVWKALPDMWMEGIARLLAEVESSGTWPESVLNACVTMFPKVSGGSRPRAQRPITVLDLLYQVWAKEVVMEWSGTLNTKFLGKAAMGFRAQTGTLHLAQLLSDLMVLQRRRGQELWLISLL